MMQAGGHDLQAGKWLAGAALGALAMYLLDPERGAVRRAQSARALRRLGRQTGDALGKAGPGLMARACEAGADATPALADQAGAAAPEQPGQPGGQDHGAPGQAGSSGPAMPALAERPAEPDERWNNGLRGAAVAGGGALGLYGLLSSRSPLGLLLGLAGLALLTRGASNRPLRRMLGAGSQGQAVEVEKTIRINAPPEQVYDLFANYENFPRFMSNVVEVRDLGQRRSHWVVKGPAGTEFAWNAVLTEQARPRRLAWHSEPGAEVAQTGSIRFEPFRNGTRVTLRMAYWPPAGAVGHALASLLGSDPKRQLDDDLARMKMLVERGAMGHADAAPGALAGKLLH
jgi:uncharacterized membrane protein